jgi:hypothetical protein
MAERLMPLPHPPSPQEAFLKGVDSSLTRYLLNFKNSSSHGKIEIDN